MYVLAGICSNCRKFYKKCIDGETDKDGRTRRVAPKIRYIIFGHTTFKKKMGVPGSRFRTSFYGYIIEYHI